jgi:hypothetical protein
MALPGRRITNINLHDLADVMGLSQSRLQEATDRDLGIFAALAQLRGCYHACP